MAEDVCDTAGLPGCREVVIELQRAYMAVTSGNKRMRVRFQDRWTEYNPANATQLLTLIRMVQSQCPGCEDLLDLNPGRRVQRGPPAFLRFT